MTTNEAEEAYNAVQSDLAAAIKSSTDLKIQLTTMRAGIDSNSHNCKVANTVSNVGTIAGVGMLFFPLTAPVGIYVLGASALTGFGVVATDVTIDYNYRSAIETAVRNNEAVFVKLIRTVNAFLKIEQAGNAAYRTFTAAMAAKELLRLRSLLIMAEKLTGLTARGVINGTKVITTGTKLMSKTMATVTVGLSALDMVLTWTMPNPTTQDIDKLIDATSARIEVLNAGANSQDFTEF